MRLSRISCFLIFNSLLAVVVISTACGPEYIGYTGRLTPEDVSFEELVVDADIITVCEITQIEINVDGVIELLDETPDWRSSVVTFSVLETLKGDTPQEFEMRHLGGIDGIDPPIYQLGERRLQFYFIESGSWHLPSYYYGDYIINENNYIGDYPLSDVTKEIKEILSQQ